MEEEKTILISESDLVKTPLGTTFNNIVEYPGLFLKGVPAGYKIKAVEDIIGTFDKKITLVKKDTHAQ